VTEAEEVTKFVSEHGFEVVSLRRRGECLRRRKRGIRISRAEVDIRVENLTKFRGIALPPIWMPVTSAVMTRVNARTPGVKAMSIWSKQMELRPSAPQGFCVAVRVKGVRVRGNKRVPLTPVHTARDWVMVCSISLRRPLGV